MALKVGTGYADILPRLAPGFESQIASALKPKVAKAGADAGGFFAQNFASKAKSQFKGMTGLVPEGLSAGTILGVAAIAATIAAVQKAISVTIQYAGEVRALQRITGASAEDSSLLAANLHALGIETNSVSRPMLTLSQNIEKPNATMKKYFTTAELARLKNRDLIRDLPLLQQRFQSLENQNQRNELAIGLFGKRGGTEMLKLLNETNDFRDAVDAAARAQGLVFTDKDLRNAFEYQVSVRELGATFKGLEVQAGKGLIPIVGEDLRGINTIILGAEKGVQGLRAASDKVSPKPIKELSDRILHVVSTGTLGLIGELGDRFFGLNKNAEKVPQTLDDIAQSAASDEAQAKRLQQAFTDAFSIADKAAADFEKRLDALVPKIDDTFSGAKTPAERAQAIFDATGKVADAEDKLAVARKKASANEKLIVRTPGRDKALADARRDLAGAERDLTKARTDATKAGAISDVPGVGDLGKDITQNTKLLQSFGGDLTKLTTRLKTVTVKGGEDAKQAFLAHLQDLGPAAVPLLDALVTSSDTELAKLAGGFGEQVQAAKRAADIQFDKFPANFSEKIGRARAAAATALEPLVKQFEGLPDKVDTPEWRQKLGDMALTIDAMAKQGILSLTPVEQEFLHTAETADTADARAHALQELIDSLHGKRVDIFADVHDKPLRDFLATLNSTERKVFDIQFAPVILPPKKGAATGPPKAIKSPEDVLKGALGGKAAGGPVMKGRSYVVGEEGWEVFQPTENGMVIPHDQALAMANRPASHSRSTTIQVGEVRAHDYHDFRRQMEREERTDALVNGT